MELTAMMRKRTKAERLGRRLAKAAGERKTQGKHVFSGELEELLRSLTIGRKEEKMRTVPTVTGRKLRRHTGAK